MTSEIVILITELRNKQRITLPAGAYRFGRSAQCEYVLRRNSVGDHQFTVSYEKDGWVVTDGASDYRTWYNNRYLEPGETSVLQAGDVIGLNTDGNSDTQEITFRVEEITNVQGDGAALIKEQTTEAVLREVDIRRKKRVLIGRGDDCDIKLVSDRVSRHHCEVLYKDGHYELHDLGSTNGTFVNGRQIKSTALHDADRIIVMESGRIAAMGTHEELLETSEIYRETFTSQNKMGEEAVDGDGSPHTDEDVPAERETGNGDRQAAEELAHAFETTMQEGGEAHE